MRRGRSFRTISSSCLTEPRCLDSIDTNERANAAKVLDQVGAGAGRDRTGPFVVRFGFRDLRLRRGRVVDRVEQSGGVADPAGELGGDGEPEPLQLDGMVG